VIDGQVDNGWRVFYIAFEIGEETFGVNGIEASEMEFT
jgi:hypothetical protein